jgi:hypothetical protein
MMLEQVLNNNIIHLDFEIAANNNLKHPFTGINVKGCRFHFCIKLYSEKLNQSITFNDYIMLIKICLI